MFTDIVRYTDDAAGLEKSLRLLQGFCNIAIGLSSPHDPITLRYTAARNQLALGRRYFRIFKWYPCWTKTSQLMAFPQWNVPAVLKFSFLGLYFFLEALTITNGVGLTQWDYGPLLLRESNRCWFYALVASLVVSLLELWSTHSEQAVEGDKTGGDPNGTAPGVKRKEGKKKRSGKKTEPNPSAEKEARNGGQQRTKVYTQMVIDSADLFIPGAALGWINVSPAVVGTASTISTVLAGRQIWDRIQRVTDVQG